MLLADKAIDEYGEGKRLVVIGFDVAD